MLMQKATILCRWRLTKVWKKTKANFQTNKALTKTQKCTKYFTLKIVSWMQSAVPIPHTKLAANWTRYSQPLGVNKLSAMKKEISFSTNLSLVSSNYSVRATAITLWANAGLTNHEIFAIFGHATSRTYKAITTCRGRNNCVNAATRSVQDWVMTSQRSRRQIRS